MITEPLESILDMLPEGYVYLMTMDHYKDERRRELINILVELGNYSSPFAQILSRNAFRIRAGPDGLFKKHMRSYVDFEMMNTMLCILHETTTTDQYFWLDTTLNELNFDNISTVLFHLMKIGFPSHNEHVKIMSLKSAQAYLCLMITLVDHHEYFNDVLFNLCLRTTNLYTFDGSNEIEMELKLLLQKINIFLTVYELEINNEIRILNYFTTLLTKITELSFFAPDDTSSNTVVYFIYVCLVTMVRHRQESVGMILNTLNYHLFSENDRISYSPKQNSNIQQNILHLLINVIKIVPREFSPSVSIYLKEMSLNITSHPCTRDTNKMIGDIVVTLNSHLYIDFIEWYKIALSNSRCTIRESMFYIIEFLLKKPDHRSDDEHNELLHFFYDTCNDGMIDNYGNIRQFSIMTLAKIFNSEDLHIQRLNTEIFTNTENPKKCYNLLQRIEILLNKPIIIEKNRKNFIIMLCNIVLIDEFWMSDSVLKMLLGICDTMTPEEHLIINTLMRKVYKKYSDLTIVIQLYVHTVILDFMDDNVTQDQAIFQEIYDAIFDRDTEILIKDNAWKLISVIIMDGLSLDNLFYKILKCKGRRGTMAKITVPDSFVPNLHTYINSWIVLTALNPFIVEFEGADQMAEIFMENVKAMTTLWCNPENMKLDENTTVNMNQYLTIGSLKRFISPKKKKTIRKVIFEALMRSSIGAAEIHSAFSLCIHLFESETSEQWDKASIILTTKEKEVFKNFTRISKQHDNKSYLALTRDMISIGEAALSSSTHPDQNTIGLIGIFIKPKKDSGADEFFNKYANAWVAFISTFTKLCVRTKKQVDYCLDIARALLKVNPVEVKKQAVKTLYDLYQVYNVSFQDVEEDFFNILKQDDPELKEVVLNILSHLIKDQSVVLLQANHLKFVLMMCDQNKGVARFVDAFVDRNYIGKNFTFILNDITTLVNTHYAPDDDPVKIAVSSEMRMKFYFSVCHQATDEYKHIILNNISRKFFDVFTDKQVAIELKHIEIIKECLFIIICCLPCTDIKDLILEYKESHEQFLMLIHYAEGDANLKYSAKKGDNVLSFIRYFLPIMCSVWQRVPDNASITPGFLTLMTILYRLYNLEVLNLSKRDQDTCATLCSLYTDAGDFDGTHNIFVHPCFHLYHNVSLLKCKTKQEYDLCVEKKYFYEKTLNQCAVKYI